MTISDRIKDVIKQRGYSIAYVAKYMRNERENIIGISQQSLSTMLKGNIPYSRVAEIASIIGIPMSELVDFDDRPDAPTTSGVQQDESVSDRVRRMVKEKGLNLLRLSKLMGVTNQSLYALLSPDSRPTRKKLKPIADAIGCDVADFFPNRQVTDSEPDSEPEKPATVSELPEARTNVQRRMYRIISERGLDVRSLANILHKSPDSVTRILDGNPRLDTILEIAGALGVSAADFFKD